MEEQVTKVVEVIITNTSLLLVHFSGHKNDRLVLRLSKKSFVGFHMARDKGRPLATLSLAVGRFAAKKSSLRSPRGRLVASLAGSKTMERCFKSDNALLKHDRDLMIRRQRRQRERRKAIGF